MKTQILLSCIFILILLAAYACKTRKKLQTETIHQDEQVDVSGKNEVIDFSTLPNLFTTEQSGEKTKLSVGDTLNLLLAANATTGYAWAITNMDSTILQKEEAKYYADKVEPKVVGSGGNQWFAFKATGNGNTTLKLVYKRPWEANTATGKVFELEVVVE